MGIGVTYPSTRKRTAYCAAIVSHVYRYGDSATKRRLSDDLTERCFTERSLMDLVHMAGDYGVPDDAIDRCEDESDEVIPEPTFVCSQCLDSHFVEVTPGRWGRCPNCNPTESPEPQEPEDVQ